MKSLNVLMNVRRRQTMRLKKGRLLAFNEVLSIIKTDFVGDEEIEKLLNFDVDKRYG